MKDWTPQPSAVEWMRQMLERLNHDGIWGIPINRSVWRHDKINRILRCIHGERDYLFTQMTTTCARLGYKTQYTPEDMPPAQVEHHIKTTPTQFTENMFGTGKSLVIMTNQPTRKKYVWRALTTEDKATYQINLAKLPKEMRYKGKLTPQCDFCGDDQPTVTYAAHRLTSGEAVECWRWLACAPCHEIITRNDFKNLEARALKSMMSTSNMDSKIATFAIKMVFTAFHKDAAQA